MREEAYLSTYPASEEWVRGARAQEAFEQVLVPPKWHEIGPKRMPIPLAARQGGTLAEVRTRCQKILRYWMTEERATFETFLKEVRACVLALNQEPILSGSGMYEMVPVGQMPYAEVANQIANELANLADHTAKIRIKSMSDNGMVEHTIQTLGPERRTILRGTALQQRIETIRTQNLRDGLRRPREEEMRRRQAPYGQLAQQLRRGVRCGACGANNSQNAQFCNQCGSKL
jgi:hypothetical protein